MKKYPPPQLCILLAFFLFSSVQIFAQTRTITGIVKDTANQPLVAATVKVKGSNIATSTGNNGAFTMNNVPAGNVDLEVTYIGYNPETVSVGSNESSVSVILKSGANTISDVVVTALGISRQAKTLTYSTQKVTNDELTTVKSTNVLNSLNGKVAGVQINRTGGGAGGSVRVVLRGDKSTRNSQPLYVIDGLPIQNPTGGPDAGLYAGTPDNGDIMSTINPDDIADITILKGASASALYGSQGSNGVILITTKKGKSGTARVDFSSGLTFDKAFVFPDLQYRYGQTPLSNTSTIPEENGSEDSWGAKGTYPGSGDVKSFFKTGTTWINGISFSAGTEKSNSYFSYSNTDNSGIVPTSTLKQNTLTFRQSSKFFNDKLLFDGTFIGSTQNTNNRLTPGIYFNPLSGLYVLPRGFQLSDFAQYETLSESRYLMQQNWWDINTDKGYVGQDYQQNPYWVLHRDPFENKNQNVYAALSFKYLLNNWLTVQARGNINNYINEYQRNIGATTQATLSDPNGQVTVSKDNTTNLYGDLMLLGNKDLSKDFHLNFVLGGSIQDQKGNGTYVGGALVTPNVFLESNIDWSNQARSSLTNSAYTRQVQSVFASVDLGYKNALFLSLSDRNDWSSTLAFTPGAKKGYNYYSIGANAVLSDLFDMPAAINFAKVRVSYAQVGNDVNPYATLPLYTFNRGIATAPGSQPINVPGFYLQPEKNKSFEVGTEWRFMQSRLMFSFTWYKSNVTHQYFANITVNPGLGYGTHADVNGGNIQNTGEEISLSYKVLQGKNLSWTTMLNFSQNTNKVLAVYDASITPDPSVAIPPVGLAGGVTYMAKGYAFGSFFGHAFKRDDEGHIVVQAADGKPLTADNQQTYLGNPNPKFILGWNNTFDIKDFTIGFLIDGKFGGKVMSLSEPYLDQHGVSERSAVARDNGGVVIPGAVDETGHPYTSKIDPQVYYKAIGGSSPINEAYLYDATAIRLREFSVSYGIPLKNSIVKNLRIGLIGSNLFFITKKAPFDPEQVASVSPGGVGVDVFGFPAYRSIGFSLKCSF